MLRVPPGNHNTNDTLVLVITTFCPLLTSCSRGCSFVRMAAGKFDLTVFLDSVDAEYTQDLLRHGVDSLHKVATLKQDKLKEWKVFYGYGLRSAITKAQRLVRSSDAVVQEELLVSDTNLYT